MIASLARADLIQSPATLNVNLTTLTTGATVYVGNQSSTTVSVGSITVTGSSHTFVDNFPATQNSYISNPYLIIGGTVAVNQVDSGTVAVTNFPAVQQVYWAMPQDVAVTMVQSPVDVTGSTVSVNVATHTSVDNFPANLATNATLTGGNAQTQVTDNSGHTWNIDPSGTGRVNVINMPAVTGMVSVSGQVQTSTHVIVDNQVVESTHVTVDNFVAPSTHTWVDNQITTNTISTRILGDNILAGDRGIVTQSAIHGLSSGGGGAYVDVKVSPSGALTVDASGSSISGTVSVSGQVQTSTHVIVDNFVAPSTHTFVDNQVTVSTHVTVDNFPASQAVTGTFFPATQPVSGTVSISGQVATSTHVIVDNLSSTQPVSVVGFPSVLVYSPATISTSTVSAAAAVGSATMTAVVGQFHYLAVIEVTAYSSAARTGVATPLTCVTTNLLNNPSLTFATAGAIGTTDTRFYNFGYAPIRSAVTNTNTVITCPATTGVIWRINLFYYTGA